ncbi:Uncharacterised protein [Bordetella pertussis]|nr:Uncharacterised protein [Bordetella pertussis]CFW16356.1 Uncharacterised protein [Bordetella pertussis]
MWMALPGGVYLAAFSSRLHSTRSIRMPSHFTSGRAESGATVTGRSCSAAFMAARAEPTSSSTDCHWRRSGASWLCSRAMSSRLTTSACMRRAWSCMAATVSSAAGVMAAGERCRVSAMPSKLVSGVRRSCETAASRALRRRSDSILSSACWATST